MTRTRVTILGDAETAALCAPAGPEIERLPADGAESLDVVLVFGWNAAAADELDGLSAPAVVWLASGDPPRPAGLRPEDRVIATAPGVPDAWRLLPLPVADELFAPATDPDVPGCAAWIAAEGERRRDYLGRFEHSVELVDDLTEATVAVCLHEGEQPAFDPGVGRALAAGKLVVSEALEPRFGLEPGIDYLEALDLTDLFVAVENAARTPEAFRRVRLRGRRKAEWFRSSRVVSRLAHDLRVETESVRARSR